MKRQSSVFFLLRRAGSLPRFAITSMIVAPCAFPNIGVSWAEQGPAFVLHRTVTYADRQTYIELPFEVPKGVTRVSIETSYTEREKHTTIDLGLFDGERFRGWSGGNKTSFTVSETDATPSYLPGPVRPDSGRSWHPGGYEIRIHGEYLLRTGRKSAWGLHLQRDSFA